MRPKGKLLALFAIFAAIGLVTASGAFTTVQAERTVTVNTAGDANALLALEPNSTSQNSDYASNQNGEVVIDLSNSNLNTLSESPGGVNINATTNITHIINVSNQGTQPVGFYVDPDNSQHENLSITMYNGSDTSDSIEGSTNSVRLTSGDQISVGISIETTGNVSDFEQNVTFVAEAAEA